jgi:tryptophanyl-tRNA synthetase
MSQKVSLTGVKPTGMPHLGNYVGAIRPAIQLANSGEYKGYYFIADYHSLTTIYDGKKLNDYIYEVAACWLACGLDPNKTVIYRQSDVPEVLELNWILSCFTNKGLMNRAHAYKAIVQDNVENKRDEDQGVNIGIYTYPILMAADILLLSPDVVPVGPDQMQHIEIARDIANAYNHHYGEILKLPEGLARDELQVEGLDGRKMSKSYGNHIPIFESEKRLKKLINKIKTDTSAPEDPKDPDDSIIFTLFKHFSNEDQQKELADWFRRGIGWGEAKAELFKVVNAELAGPRERYQELLNDRKQIDEILERGRDEVKGKAQELLKQMKDAIGVSPKS